MYDGYPLHRLNTAHMLAWLLFPVMKRQMASWMGKNYKTGVVVLSPTLLAVATVTPTGVVNELRPPHRRFEFHQCDNKPSARYGECACRGYYDPESGDAWGKRDKERARDEHHPFCQGRTSSMTTWSQAFQSATARVAEGKKAQTRPDEWERRAKENEG